ncbi:MAG: DnaD domain protein [Clostridia bacterium]|nr:DnaD domain protein [Clostridia bacterium]MBR0422653.1 DnaD domain protein [Clostridia bacterium]
MNIHFSPEAQKREQTPVDNLFFSEYMPDADGEAVKVYLYGLMQCRFPSMGDVALSEALNLPEGAVRAAFVYWQSKGLVRILKDEPLEVEYLTVEQPAVTTAVPVKYRSFIRALNELIAPRRFNMNELGHIYDCIETFRLEEKTVLELVSHCMEEKGRNVRIQYILTVAKSWADAGIVTYEQAREYIANATVRKHGATAVLRRWNKRRSPTLDEMALYDSWVREWGFDDEAILAVCPRLTNTSSPSFEALGDRLRELYEQNKVKAEDIRADSDNVSDEKEFARMVFARMGKVSTPTRDEIRQLAVFLEGPEGLSREVVLLAAEECADAERPFGKLKAILKDWTERKVRTVEEATKALQQRQTQFAQADGRRRTRGKNTLLNYAEQGVSHANLDDIALDLDEL